MIKMGHESTETSSDIRILKVGIKGDDLEAVQACHGISSVVG
jgi:hypothetical protein